MTSKKDFLDLIKGQRSTKAPTHFEGTFLDYLALVKNDPDIVKLSHKRLFEAVIDKGTRPVDTSDERCRKLFEGDPFTVYSHFEKDFFGMERVISRVMDFLKAASLKGEESRQILLLMGPVGAGKSALMESIKRALESAPECYHLQGCPIREEPLHLIPRSLRGKFSDMLGISIEGDLCPVCRYRLIHEFDQQYENFPVTTSAFSIRGRKGIGVVPPVDANTQDVSILIGSEDISKMDKYSDDDPRILSLNGAFDVGNRGIVEFVEIFKNEIEFIHPAITATQEKLIPSPGKHPMIYWDGVILSHCNEAEWNKFKSDHLNEAIMDRIVRVDVPYVLELDQEIKIYEKRLKESNFDAHIAPHTIKIASMFSVMSRLKPTQKVDVLTKLRIYNGEDVIEKGRVKKIDIKDLREEAPGEGMTGISTRFIMKSIDRALTKSTKNMITPISVLDALIENVKDQIPDAETRSYYLKLLQDLIRKEYLSLLEKEIARAFITAFEENAESLFQNYLDNAEAFVMKQKIKDRVTNEEMTPDVKFMEDIEDHINITDSAREGFRHDITSYMFTKMRRQEKIDFKSYKPLREAIETYMMSSIKDMARIVTKTRTRDDDQRKKYNEMIGTLINEYGYSESSAEEILTFAANNLWRDS